MAEGSGPYLELKSERVQRELAGLAGWEATEAGLEATFQFVDGSQALFFLRRLGHLLDAHPVPPRRLELRGPALTITLGESAGEQIHVGDLALAGRILELNEAIRAAFQREDQELWA